jgi:RNA polymerase-associated protein CTR9
MSQREKEEQARIEAEKLAEDRRLAREQALEWTREVRMDSDDEQEKRPKRAKKAKADVTSGDEGEPKKKKRGKIKKSGNEQGEEDQAMFSEEDDAEKPTKKVGEPEVAVSCLVLLILFFLSAAVQETSGAR